MTKFGSAIRPFVDAALREAAHDTAATIALTIEDAAEREVTNPDVRAGMLKAAEVAHRFAKGYAT